MYKLPELTEAENELLYKLIEESERIKATSNKFKALSKLRWDSIAKPIDSLGEFEAIFQKLSSITETLIPDISKKCIIVICSDNGIVEEGISQSKSDVTLAVAKSMALGTSSVSVLAGAQGVKLSLIDMGIKSDDKEIYSLGVHNYKLMHGTNNFLKERAMPFEITLNAILKGIELVYYEQKSGINLLGTGEMGIGNTTTSTALAAVLLDINPENITGRGAGLDDAGVLRKIRVISKGIDIYGFNSKEFKNLLNSKDNYKRIMVAVDLLSSIGGLDIAGLVGVFIGAAMYKVPVVIDGVISEVAALISFYINPMCKEFMIASHLSKEVVGAKIFDILDLKPVINASMALGEGSGCALFFPLLDLICEIYKKNAFFNDIGIEEYKRFK